MDIAGKSLMDFSCPLLSPQPFPILLNISTLHCQEYINRDTQKGPAPELLSGRFDEDYFMFGFNFASTDITLEKEVWAYPTISFFAEMCGSLRKGLAIFEIFFYRVSLKKGGFGFQACFAVLRGLR